MTRADDRRVAEIGRYRVIGEPPRQDLVALVELAAQVAGVPMATINLVTATQQVQVAAVGFEASVCAREDSMCNVVLHAGHPVIVPDARPVRDRAHRPGPVLRHPPAGHPRRRGDRDAVRLRRAAP
jgi:hypothetical protein